MPLEIERKYLGVDFDRLKRALETAGAHHLDAHFESNIIFDTPDRRLLAAGRLLRLRRQEWPDHTQSVLTVKLPAPDTVTGMFKAREERELTVENDLLMAAVLEGLGFCEVARYEKVRDTWRLPPTAAGERAVLVELDELPFARVVEVEGGAEALDAVAARLGLDNCEISTKSYHALHQEWRNAEGLSPEPSFRFGPEQWRSLRQKIGLSVPAAPCL